MTTTTGPDPPYCLTAMVDVAEAAALSLVENYADWQVKWMSLVLNFGAASRAPAAGVAPGAPAPSTLRRYFGPADSTGSSGVDATPAASRAPAGSSVPRPAAWDAACAADAVPRRAPPPSSATAQSPSIPRASGPNGRAPSDPLRSAPALVPGHIPSPSPSPVPIRTPSHAPVAAALLPSRGPPSSPAPPACGPATAPQRHRPASAVAPASVSAAAAAVLAAAATAAHPDLGLSEDGFWDQHSFAHSDCVSDHDADDFFSDQLHGTMDVLAPSFAGGLGTLPEVPGSEAVPQGACDIAAQNAALPSHVLSGPPAAAVVGCTAAPLHVQCAAQGPGHGLALGHGEPLANAAASSTASPCAGPSLRATDGTVAQRGTPTASPERKRRKTQGEHVPGGGAVQQSLLDLFTAQG